MSETPDFTPPIAADVQPYIEAIDLAAARAALADMTRQRDEAVKAFQRERAKVVNHEATLAHMKDAAGIALEWYDDGAIEMGVDIAAYRRLRDWVHGGPRRHGAAPQTPVHASEAPGQGSGGQRAGDGL